MSQRFLELRFPSSKYYQYHIWLTVKNGPSRICGRQPLKNLETAYADHITSNFLKAVFGKLYLGHSWIPLIILGNFLLRDFWKYCVLWKCIFYNIFWRIVKLEYSFNWRCNICSVFQQTFHNTYPNSVFVTSIVSNKKNCHCALPWLYSLGRTWI